MAEQAQNAPETTHNPESEDEHNFLVAGIYKLVLAGIGVASLAQEEIEDLISNLVERGQLADKDGRKMLNELSKARKKQTGNIENQLDGRVDDLLVRLNIPKKSEVEALNAKIATLSQKLDALNLDELELD